MLKWAIKLIIIVILVSFLLACVYGLTIGTDTTGANTSFICSTWCDLGDPPGGDEEWRACFEDCLDRIAPEVVVK